MSLKGNKQQHEEDVACPGSFLLSPLWPSTQWRSPGLGRHPRWVSVVCPFLERKQGLERLPLSAGLSLLPDVGTMKRRLTIGKASKPNCLWHRQRASCALVNSRESESEQHIPFLSSGWQGPFYSTIHLISSRFSFSTLYRKIHLTLWNVKTYKSTTFGADWNVQRMRSPVLLMSLCFSEG